MCALRFDHLRSMREELLTRALASTFFKQARLKMRRHEDELHRRLGLRDERFHEAPCPDVIEVHIGILSRDAVATDVREVRWLRRIAGGVEQVEANVRIASAAVGAMRSKTSAAFA